MFKHDLISINRTIIVNYCFINICFITIIIGCVFNFGVIRVWVCLLSNLFQLLLDVIAYIWLLNNLNWRSKNFDYIIKRERKREIFPWYNYQGNLTQSQKCNFLIWCPFTVEYLICSSSFNIDVELARDMHLHSNEIFCHFHHTLNHKYGSIWF